MAPDADQKRCCERGLTCPVIVAIRVLILIAFPLAGWGVAIVLPELLTRTGIQYLTAVFAGIWGLHWLLLTRISDLSNLQGLSDSERDRLALVLADLRKRSWHIGRVCLLATVAMVALSARAEQASTELVGIAVGALLGIGASYLVIVPAWSEEVQSFIDTVRLRDAKKKAQQAANDEMAKATKSRVAG